MKEGAEGRNCCEVQMEKEQTGGREENKGVQRETKKNSIMVWLSE